MDASKTFLVDEEKRTRYRPTCGYCRDCKHWDAAGDLIGMVGEVDEGFGQCQLSDVDNNDPRVYVKLLAIGECYAFGSVRCKAEYGCVQWEAK